jgi:hypothetical protein
VDVEELTSGALSSVMGTAASGDEIETIAMALARTRAINSTNCTATQSWLNLAHAQESIILQSVVVLFSQHKVLSQVAGG